MLCRNKTKDICYLPWCDVRTLSKVFKAASAIFSSSSGNILSSGVKRSRGSLRQVAPVNLWHRADTAPHMTSALIKLLHKVVSWWTVIVQKLRYHLNVFEHWLRRIFGKHTQMSHSKKECKFAYCTSSMYCPLAFLNTLHGSDVFNNIKSLHQELELLTPPWFLTVLQQNPWLQNTFLELSRFLGTEILQERTEKTGKIVDQISRQRKKLR